MADKKPNDLKLSGFRDDIASRAEFFQDEMHRTVNRMMEEDPKLEYQCCVNVYLLLKISELWGYAH